MSREISTANAELAEANRRLEYMVEREHERVSAMLTAAGRTRDMMDLLPLAIIGIDEDCATPVYVNALARKYWPQLTVELGTGPSDSAVQLLRAAGEAQSQGGRMTWQGLGFKCWLLPHEGVGSGRDGRLPDRAAAGLRLIGVEKGRS